MSRWFGFEFFGARADGVAGAASSGVVARACANRPRARDDAALKRAGRLALAGLAGVKPASLRGGSVVGDWRKTPVALGHLGELPALRDQARRFAHTLARDYCLLDEVVAEVGRDPVLTANVLRLANSVAVGSGERVADLGTALQTLGVARVRMMAQVLVAMEEARDVSPGFDWTALWMHSAACASLTDRLARWSGVAVGPELPLAALLHDVGKIALSAVAPDAYRAVLVEAWTSEQALHAVEEARLGLDHREAGWIFGQEAELPRAVLSAISHHDAPEHAASEHRGLVVMVAVANRLAKDHGLGFSGEGLLARDELGRGEAWRIWEVAAGRRLDASELEERMEREWAGPVREEIAALRAEPESGAACGVRRETTRA